MNNIIMSGNPNYGLAQALAEKLGATGYSRSCGFDFFLPEKRRAFIEKSLGFSVYISCSCLDKFMQLLLLEELYKEWVKNEHKGQIIVMGSSADSTQRATSWRYPAEKKALRAYCRSLSLLSLGGHGQQPSGIRVTYVSPGYLATPHAEQKHPEVQKLDTQYVAGVIAWLLDQPDNVNISELCLDPIQMEGSSYEF